jgi:hypothetical protein
MKSLEVLFEPLSAEHEKEVMGIYNYYVENTFSAYPDSSLPCELKHYWPVFLQKIIKA